MSPKVQASVLIGAINLLSEIRDEFQAKELHGAGDEVARLQSVLRRQLSTLVEEAHLNKVDVLMPPLRTIAEIEHERAEQRVRDLVR